uniref:Transmembrane protein 80 n=1 Tax=Xiphophorus couchianus TaxID=32473 RepID=A0A3B5L2E4_9TELE
MRLLENILPSKNLCKLSSVTLQLLLNLTSIYFVFYFLFTLSLLIKKISAFLLGGNLTESDSYMFGNLIMTVTTILLAVYFLVWQTYVMRADVIISSVLITVYGADGVLALSTLAKFRRLVSIIYIFSL